MPAAQNLLLIMADDLNLALGCWGHPLAHTPNFDRLAARGVRFSHAFCPYPLCGPSRTALMTGRRPERIPMSNNEVAWRDLHPDLKTLPQIARDAGWRTAAFGKIQHHGLSASPAHDPLRALAKAEGRMPNTIFDPLSWEHEAGSEFPNPVEMNAPGPEVLYAGHGRGGGNSLHAKRVPDSHPLPDQLHTDALLRELEARAAEPSRRFFAALGFEKPHLPVIAPDRWWACYDRLDVAPLLRLPASGALPVGAPPCAVYLEKPDAGMTESERAEILRGYLASTSYIDEQLGRVLDALEHLGLWDTTTVAFVADHGFHLGEHAQWNKMTLYEESLRVPLLVAGAGVPRHSAVCPALVESLDLRQTLAELAGLPAPGDGTSLVPFLADPALASDRPVFAWISHPRRGRLREGRSIRTRTHRYSVWPSGATLFDLVADPHELNNLAGAPSAAAIERELRARLDAHFG